MQQSTEELCTHPTNEPRARRRQKPNELILLTAGSSQGLVEHQWVREGKGGWTRPEPKVLTEAKGSLGQLEEELKQVMWETLQNLLCQERPQDKIPLFCFPGGTGARGRNPGKWPRWTCHWQPWRQNNSMEDPGGERGTGDCTSAAQWHPHRWVCPDGGRVQSKETHWEDGSPFLLLEFEKGCYNAAFIT